MWQNSWYIKEEAKVAGWLTDFSFRHAPETYSRPNRQLARALKIGFFCVPGVALSACCVLSAGGG